MELKEAIDKLFEMTDGQRYEVFEYTKAIDVLESYTMSYILETIKNFYSEPKYGDVYVDNEDGYKIIIMNANFVLSEKFKCLQKMNLEYISRYYTKTDNNVADKLEGLFK